jgi:hypothetical protein
VLPQGKTEISSLLDHSGSGSHRREEHSLALVEIHLQWSHSLALELVLHSSIVTDLPWKKDCPESRICFKVDTVTRTERASPGKDRNFFIYRSHQRSGSLHRREEVHSAIVTDFAMKRLPDSHSAVSKSHICFKVEKSHERSLLPRERTGIPLTGHTSGVGLSIGEKSIHGLLLNLSTRSYPLTLELVFHFRNCDRLCLERY